MEPVTAVQADVKPSGPPLLDGMPRQRVRLAPAPAPAPLALPRPTAAPARRLPRLWQLLPTPTGTPFTFGYTLVLIATSVFTTYASPALVATLHQATSTDVAHLIRTPVFVLLASALWIAGGYTSLYVIGFVLALTALERRIGGARTVVVFLLGHVLATLATEGTVGIAVLVGHLPESSLHRMDYGISFGVAACVGALCGLLRPWLALPILGYYTWVLVEALIAFSDPMTNWGHLIALTIGVATWPWVRRWSAARR
ncbi:rhomboid-like protein [Streptomyces sp. NPDC087425]|uniref:rhomboid-like protein n=1 Tax=Streptomyces sp. NPDC087425 TaxID=3365787 RepID=UPI00380F7D6B